MVQCLGYGREIMTIKELIEKLQNFSQTDEVFILIDDLDEYLVDDVDKGGGAIWIQGKTP
jgi:hypothetical protein